MTVQETPWILFNKPEACFFGTKGQPLVSSGENRSDAPERCIDPTTGPQSPVWDLGSPPDQNGHWSPSNSSNDPYRRPMRPNRHPNGPAGEKAMTSSYSE